MTEPTGTASAGPAPTDAFGLRVPPSWQEVDLRPRTRDAAVVDLVNRRVAEVPELREHRTELVRFLRNLASQAWDGGARYCAMFAEPAGDGIIPGALTVTALPRPPAGSGESVVDAIVDQLQRTPGPAAGGDTWRSVTTTELPETGPAVQVFGVQDVELNDSGYQLRAVVMQTFVPTDTGVLLVAGTSPAVDLAEPLLEMFSAVTGTLTLHRLGPEEE